MKRTLAVEPLDTESEAPIMATLRIPANTKEYFVIHIIVELLNVTAMHNLRRVSKEFHHIVHMIGRLLGRDFFPCYQLVQTTTETEDGDYCYTTHHMSEIPLNNITIPYEEDGNLVTVIERFKHAYENITFVPYLFTSPIKVYKKIEERCSIITDMDFRPQHFAEEHVVLDEVTKEYPLTVEIAFCAVSGMIHVGKTEFGYNIAGTEDEPYIVMLYCSHWEKVRGYDRVTKKLTYHTRHWA